MKRVYQNADAAVDNPGNFFWEEILEAFPDCKVILSERDEDSWVESLANQYGIFEANKSRILALLHEHPQVILFWTQLEAIVATDAKLGCEFRYRVCGNLI